MTHENEQFELSEWDFDHPGPYTYSAKKCSCWDDMPWAPHCDDCKPLGSSDKPSHYATVLP